MTKTSLGCVQKGEVYPPLLPQGLPQGLPTACCKACLWPAVCPHLFPSMLWVFWFPSPLSHRDRNWLAYFRISRA